MKSVAHAPKTVPGIEPANLLESYQYDMDEPAVHREQKEIVPVTVEICGIQTGQGVQVKKSSFHLLAILALARYTAGQDSLLTLSGAVEYAMTGGISMRSAIHQQRSSSLDLISSRNSLYPSAQVSITASDRFDANSRRGSASAGASIGSNYELSPSQFAYHHAAKLYASSVALDVEQRRKDVTTGVVLQYVATVGASKLIGVEESNVSYQQKKLEEIEALFSRGGKARSDVLQQRSTLAEAQTRYLSAIQEHQRKKLALLDMAGLPLSNKYILDTAGVSRLLDFFSGDSSQTVFEDFPENDEIKAQRYRIESQKANLSGRRRSYIPSLSISAGWSADQTLRGGFPGEETSSGVRLGASVGIPLFDRKQRYVQLKRTELSLEQEQLELERLQRETDLEVARAALDDAMAEDRIAVGMVRHDAAKDALEATEERYRVGASTLTDLNAVQSDFLESESALLQARFDRVTSRITLLHETGRFGQIVALLE